MDYREAAEWRSNQPGPAVIARSAPAAYLSREAVLQPCWTFALVAEKTQTGTAMPRLRRAGCAPPCDSREETPASLRTSFFRASGRRPLHLQRENIWISLLR